MTATVSPPQGLGGPLAAMRSVTFIVLMYGLLVVMGIGCLIPSWISRNCALTCIRSYCRAVLWMLRVIVGTRVEVHGTIPDGPCIVASKHQSFLDVIVLAGILPRPAFVMKKSLRWAPVIGIYAARLGSIPIDRKAGSQAVRTMLDGAERRAAGRQIIIFPQGTRVRPDAKVPWRGGVVRLYQALQQPIVLVGSLGSISPTAFSSAAIAAFRSSSSGVATMDSPITSRRGSIQSDNSFSLAPPGIISPKKLA